MVATLEIHHFDLLRVTVVGFVRMEVVVVVVGEVVVVVVVC